MKGDRTIRFLGVTLGVLGAVTAALSGQAQESDPALNREISIEVRAAALADVLTHHSTSLGVRAESDDELAAQRFIVYSPRTSLASFQQAVAGLLRARWSLTAEEG